jgi:O-acetyl-ADP-ribose deacetylase (regulator of RNase III)
MPEAVSEQVRIGRSSVGLMRGDITDLEVDAFVFYARGDLALGSGFGTAISQRGGPAVQKELNELGPVETGHAVVTGAGRLKAAWIVHAVGPKFNEPDTEGKLRSTVLNALAAAEGKHVRRIALPAMGAGFYAVPLDLCARVMIETIKSYLEGDTGFQEMTICVIDNREYASFESRLATLHRQEG